MNLCSWTKQHSITVFQWSLGVLLIVLLGIFVSVMLSKTCETHVLRYLGLGVNEKHEALKFLGIAKGGILLVLQVLMSHRRSKAMEDTVRKTEQGQREDRLKKRH